MDTSVKTESSASSVERTPRRMRTLEQKLAIIQQASQPGASIALVARSHGVNANLVFSWMRLHRRGLLESRRHGKAVPLLPVRIGTPTLTPTERAPLPGSKRPRRAAGDEGPQAMLELVLPDGLRVRLYGDAQRAVLDRLLSQLASR